MKLKFKISDEDGQILEKLKESTSTSEAEITGKALRLYSYYLQKKNDNAEFFVSEGGKQSRLELLF